MFVAIVGAGIIGGIIAATNDYGDYSDYSDYSDYRRYSDAQLRSDISTAKSRLESKKNEKNEMKEALKQRMQEMAEELSEHKILEPHEEFSPKMITERIQGIEEQLNREIEEDKQELKAIDDVIMAINTYQLSHKV